jgi:ABC-2 type transport system permease protein
MTHAATTVTATADADGPGTTSTSWLLPIASLWWREVIGFLRQRSRVVGALGTPLIFWLVIGSGFGKSLALEPAGPTESLHYLEYFFPGTLVLIVFFTAIFSTISVIQDRQEGFLQAVLAAPVGRSAIVLGKVLGSTTLAMMQAVLFLLVAPLVGIPLTIGSFLAVLGSLLLVSIGLSALGFLIAWPMESVQGFHAIMNVLLMPMWLLSGAAFPAGGASAWIRVAMAVNPVTYHVALVRHCLYLGSRPPAGSMPSLPVSLAISGLLTLLSIALAARAVARTG